VRLIAVGRIGVITLGPALGGVGAQAADICARLQNPKPRRPMLKAAVEATVTGDSSALGLHRAVMSAWSVNGN
jgi:hypothetical protein